MHKSKGMVCLKAGQGKSKLACGLFAKSATVCTNVTRSFWYRSKTCKTALVDDIACHDRVPAQ